MAAFHLSPRVSDRLAAEDVIWLSTVNARHGPVPTPVWFLWFDDSFLLFSQPGTAKLRHIDAESAVALNLNSDDHGGDVAVFTGQAKVDDAGPTDEEWAAFTTKYAHGFVSIDMTPDEFARSYSVLVRVTPERLRAW
ncbi:TIGR03667 family PPOX class F420-dependent oxidoreductase [Gordonia sp. PKS22-38]|uniref:TIGR03667 family PPOX class F420-dependent oxidoreductase n=1 Tax=Gordonia prachuapensis TaxID=3115651 RepID=A0ABU7MNC2_9ACTN|nr:TIGR03667 family PPOX class F420-dependent oxidoreductase [Gordonia sp. PKS22-38]